MRFVSHEGDSRNISDVYPMIAPTSVENMEENIIGDLYMHRKYILYARCRYAGCHDPV